MSGWQSIKDNKPSKPDDYLCYWVELDQGLAINEGFDVFFYDGRAFTATNPCLAGKEHLIELWVDIPQIPEQLRTY